MIGGNLDDAERRPVGALPDELGVEGDAAGRLHPVCQGHERGAGRQDGRRLGHGAPPAIRLARRSQPASGGDPRRLDGAVAALLSSWTMTEQTIDAFRQELRAWLEANVPDRLRPENAARLPEAERIRGLRAWQKQLAEARCVGIHWPHEFGGRDASIPEQIAYVEEMARVRAPRSSGTRHRHRYR